MLTSKWIRSGMEDRRVGMYALQSLHREIARELLVREDLDESSSESTGNTREARIAVLNYFMKYFKTVLIASDSKPFEIRIAIRGFGSMSKACSRLMSEEYMNELLLLVMQRTESVYFVEEKSKDLLEHLPDFVQALSDVMSHVRELTNVQLASLQNIITGLIKDFHYLSQSHHVLVVDSLLKTFQNLANLGGTVLDSLLEKIVLRGVIWSCSHMLVVDANQERNVSEGKSDWKDYITYKYYVPLWKGLLSQGTNPLMDRGPLIKVIYTHMMKVLFLILDKLNLNTRKRTVKDTTGESQELYFCDPNVDLVPVKPKDFHIFFNLVDLYQDLFRYNVEIRDHFEDWIPIYFDVMVKKSLLHPLVSGFVKLIDLGLVNAHHLQYFQTPHSSSKMATTNLLVYFLELQIAKARNSSGELQLTCLRVVLNAPISLLESFLEDSNEMIEIFRKSFKLGKGMLSLANMALSCVQRVVAYDSSISENSRERVIAKTLPLLDSYLQTRDTVSSGIMSSRLAKFQRKRSVNLTSSKIEKIKMQHALDSSETGLIKFQRRVVLFLGQLEPHMCTKMVLHESVDEQEDTERPLVLWDLDSNCNISLQLLAPVGIRPVIRLDTIIARVCTLAISSSDRKTKMASCELLHALILYIIGIQHHDRMTKLWSELCNHMLQLCTDPDIAVCQMFEPLIFQLIHYLTQPSKISLKGTEVLANCLMNSISHPTDTSIRDLAARCIREFLLWTIKQTLPGQQTALASINLKVILEKLRTYCLDSNPNRRQGAALAFNNIYRVLREEETHIERNWFALFFAFSVNFIMTEDFDSSTTNLEQVSATIDHLVRVLIIRKDLFNRASAVRIVPKEFRGGLLKDLVVWLLKQCSSKETSYRHKCMEVFPKLASAVDGCRSGAEFVRKFSNSEDLLNICDHSDLIYGIRGSPNLQFIVDNKLPVIVNIYVWLEYFSSSLDMYHWLLKNSFVSNSEAFLEQSKLFKAVEYFLSSVVNATMFDLMSLLRPEIIEESHSSIEFRVCTEKVIKFHLLKCTIAVRIIDLLVTVLPQQCCRSVPESFWNSDAVLNFVVDLVFEPQRIGFDFKSSQDTIAKFSEKVEELLTKIERFGHINFKQKVYRNVSVKLGRTIKDLSDRLEELMQAETIGLEDSNYVKGIFIIAKRYEIYKKHFGEHTNAFLETVSDKLIHDVFDGLKRKRTEEFVNVTLTPSVRKFSATVLRAAVLFKSPAAIELLMELVLDGRKLQLFQQSDKSVILHGEYFTNTFEEPIYEHVLQQIPGSLDKLVGCLNVETFSMVIRMFCHFLEFSYQKKRLQINILQAITEHFLNSWEIITGIASQVDNKFGSADLRLIELMSNVAMASPISLNELGRKAIGFQQWLLTLIENPQNQLDLKSKALFLLPALVGDTDLESGLVSAALRRLQDQHFPLRSSEFSVSSMQRISFESCIVALLDAMVVSRSPVILEAVINATAADPDHIAEQKIRTALGEYIRVQNSSKQCSNLKQIFLKFCDESLEPSIRLTVLQRFLITGIRQGSVETILAFYKLFIKRIYEMIRSNYGQYGAGWDAEQALVNRFGGYQLIELYVAILPRSMVINEDCMVTKALYGETEKTPGNKMITDFTKKAYACRTEVFLTPDSPTAELFRKYQCAAYRALAAIISNTKEDLQLYNVLLFRESHEKNEFIWRKLINCSEDRLYDCTSQELEDYPKIKDKIVSIRRLNSASGQSASIFKYIQMTSVFESSLSQDVTKLDLNYSVVRSTQEVAAREVDELTQQIHRRYSVPLEQSKINDHEVMATVCAVIQHMHENKITPTMEEGRVAPPPWIKFLAASVRDQQQHKNVRLFLVKVIDNSRQWLKPYASTLVPPLMQVIVDECIAAQLNTFVTDLIALILEWSEVYQPKSLDEIALASSLVKFVMRNCFHVRKEVFRLNLELTKNLIEQWKGVISIPVQLLYDMIGPAQDPESQQNLCGLQLNAVVLANGLVPWTETSKFDFIRAIFRCLDSEKTAVYRPASELMGMCLSLLYPAGEQTEDERYQNEFVVQLLAIRKTHEYKFMDIIYGIHKTFPSIVDSFLSIVSHAIPNATGASKKIFLEMLLSRVEAYKEQVHRELISLDLKGLLRDRKYQLLALHLINKSVSLMTTQNLDDILDNVISLINNDRSEVRDVVYEILIFIHENCLQEPENTKQKLRKALLAGLNDTDQLLQSHVFEFWTDASRFPEEIDARFERILADLYDPSQEANLLGFGIQTLLSPAIKNPESKRQIFQHEYEADVKLKEYSIDTRWYQRNSIASVPLFVESQQRYFTASDGSQMEQLIKATQFRASDNAFEPTLDPTVMSQTSSTFTLPTQNSLLFEVNPPILDRRSRRTAAGAEPAIGKSSKSYDSLRKRILKDKERSTRDQAMRAIERHSYEAVKKYDTLKKKQDEVVLYRRYRIGDFPDLIINSLALLLPLQAACRRDPVLARQVFVSIFTGILDEWEHNEHPANETILAISRSIQKILTETKSCDPNVFGALIEMAMKRPRIFDLSADSVATVASGANMMDIGVLYLESKLHEYDFPDESIVSRSSAVTMEAVHWIKLAELYHMLNEYDVLGDIFSDKMDSDTRLKQAIELESIGNFYRAKDLYHTMILENYNRLAEQNFCYQSYYNCYEQMCMWEDLLVILENQIEDNIEEFWTDEWNMDNILPSYFHCNTRLNLAGDERGRDFIRLLEGWMRIPDRMDYMKTNFGEEITMLQLANGEYSRAKMYSEQVLRHFLQEWSYLNDMATKLRVQKLLDIRKVAEIHTYSEMLGNHLEEKQLKQLVANWQASFPTASDSLLVWDALLTYRKFLLNLLETKLEGATDDRLLQIDFVGVMKRSIFDAELHLLDAAFEQNNTRFTRQVIKRLEVLADEQSDSGYRWRIAQLKMRRVCEMESGGDPTTTVQRMGKNFERLRTVVEAADLDRYANVKVEGLQELYWMSETLRNIVRNNPQMDVEGLRKFLPFVEREPLDRSFNQYSQECLLKSIEITSKCLMESSTVQERETVRLADCHFMLAQFCNEEIEREALGETTDLERQLIESLLASMQYGSKPARQLFPCLLQLPHLQDGTLHREFVEASCSVPEWMFLRWIPQILSYVDYASESFLADLLLRIASSYPMALYYSTKLSYGNFLKDNSGKPVGMFATKLMAALDFPKMDRFTKELCQVLIPCMKVKRIASAMMVKLSHSSTIANKEQFRQLVTEMMVDCFPDITPDLGSEHKKILTLKTKWLELLDYDFDTQKDAIWKLLNDIMKEADQFSPKFSSLDLSRYSPWLAEYHFSEREDMLELPGQYNEDRKPNVLNHVKIVKVCSRLEMFATLRKPLRLQIMGSDGKTYDFLVKYGEDLRQDQRIQQLLGIISTQLSLDQHCKDHQLSVRTYEVVPIRDDFGLIGWMPNTSSIKSIAVRSMVRFNPDGDVTGVINREFSHFLKQTAGVSVDHVGSAVYGKVAAVSSPEKIMQKFNELCYKIKPDVLKRALFEMTVSPESFYNLRGNFAKSLMAMNISCWILGIGDRHTSNLLIDRSNGKLAGVDFGLAFGAGTRDQAIPEMVPFRLTPQFVSVMEPMRTSGLMHKCLVYTLACLRNQKKILKSCLEVFVRDPTLDWLESSRRRFNLDDSKGFLSWDPQTRINIAIQKLNGSNPKILIAEEIRLGQAAHNPEFLDGYLKLLQIDKPALPNGNLTVEQQVQCLLEAATSRSILGIAYSGWFPWF
ncbi:DNA-dependent protein kinase catalytic subunit-like isoform X2 [Malaya genurostris]|nr:DNA-dependent protein kinase catalytic subunit-like isoform X2 [Malaya genurostris]